MTGQLSVAATTQSTGTIVTEACEITALGLTAGTNAATAIFRDGGATGPIRWVLGAAATEHEGDSFPSPLRFETDCHVTVTGTSPYAMVAIRRSAANQ